MKKKANLMLALLFGFSLSLGPIACGEQVADWSDIDAFSNAKNLTSSYAIEDNKLTITVNNEGSYLKNVSKANIVFRDASKEINTDKKQLSGNDLVNSGIKEYKLEVLDKFVRLTLEDYKQTLYYVVFNKAITGDKNYAYATANLVQNIDVAHKNAYVIEKGKYTDGQTDPSFTIGFDGLSVKDPTKISFSHAFEGLSYQESAVGKNEITISSKGTISKDEIGIISLGEGFFEDTDYKSELYLGISPIGYAIDNTSFHQNDNEIGFDVLLTGSSFKNGISKEDVVVPGHSVTSLELNEKKDSLYVSFASDQSLDETLDGLKGKFLVIPKTAIAHPLEEDIKIEFDINSPTTSIDATLQGKQLKLGVRYYDIIEADIHSGLIDIDSPELIFDGEGANASVSSIEDHPNGFDVYIATDEAIPNINGTLNIIESAKFKTLWGSTYHFDPLSFSAGQLQDGEPVYKALYAKRGYDENFEQKVIDSSPTIEAVSKVLQFAGYAAQLGASIYSGNAVAGIGSVLSILSLFGINGDSGQPTMQDVMNKLNAISDQLKSIDTKIDSLKQQMSDSQAALQLGIDKILFNQYRANWDGFRENYVQKMEDYLRNFQTDLHSYYIEFVRNAADVTLKLQYVTHSEKPALCIENPKDPGYSLEGEKITSNKEVKITKSFFGEASESIRKTQGYNSQFDMIFQKCIGANLKNDNPSITDEELKELTSEVYAHITGQALLNVAKENIAKDVTNLFINFCHQLIGKGLVSSRIFDYFKMLECYYNFESEAKNEFLAFRSNIKVTLDRFAGFATMVSNFCPGIERKGIADAYMETAKYIKDHDNIRVTDQCVPEFADDMNWLVDYSYVANSKIASLILKAGFSIGFNNANSNSCSLYANLKFSNYINAAIEQDASSYINNSRLLSSSTLQTMLKREINRRNTEGISTNGLNLFNYLDSKGFINDQYSSIRYVSKSQGHGETLPDQPKAITSYDGIQDLSTTSFLTYCLAKGNGDYFSTGSNYNYGDRSSGNWGGHEIRGTVYDMEKNEIYSSAMNRVCWYNEAHWYWIHDEHWAFEEYFDAFYGMAFIRVS